MGYLNYPKLFFGCVLTYEEFVKVIQTFAKGIETEGEDAEEEIWDFYEQELYKILDEKYPGLTLRDAAPHYDPEFQYYTFYISLADAKNSTYDHSKLNTDEVKKILDDSTLTTNYKKFFEDIGLEYRATEFIAICNVH